MSIPRLILASISPRRREILSYFSVPFEQVPPNFSEDEIPWEGDVPSHVMTLAQNKALSLAPKYPDAAIMAADTVVYCDGEVYGKPKDDEHARQMLTALSGRWHHVFTGIAVWYQDNIISDFEETKVLFNDLTPAHIELYQRQLHCTDKAGAYLIQQGGSIIVSSIQGCYYNVVGLPINTVRRLLKKVGIDLWEYLC